MIPSRAMIPKSIAGIFEEAAAAAVRKTRLQARGPRRLQQSTIATNTAPLCSRSSYNKQCLFQRASISTATESITSPAEAASTIPDPLGAPKVHDNKRKAPKGSPSESFMLAPSPILSNEMPSNQYPLIVGRVTKAGLNPTIAQVTRNIQKYDKTVRKSYRFDDRYLVFDADNSLREGDVVKFHRFDDDEYRARVAAGKGKLVKHVVHSILSPFGTEIKDRPRVQNRREERMKTYWSRRIEESRVEHDVQDVAERMVKDGKSKQQKVIAKKLEAAEQVQSTLNQKGVGEAEVKRRVKQAGI